MSTEFIQSSVHLTKNQKEYVNKNFINLSRLTRATIDNLIKNREGQIFKVRPSQEPREDLTNG